MGCRCFLLGAAAGSTLDVRTQALPHLVALRDATGETVQVAVLEQIEERRIVGIGGSSDRDDHGLGPERLEVRAAHLAPALERPGAVFGRGGREDRHPRPRPDRGGERQQGAIDRLHAGQELAGADERDDTG